MDKKIIHRESFGSQLSIAIRGNLTSENRQLADSLGLEIMPLSLQQLIIYLTKEQVVGRAVDAK
ncbi:hypothetical protein D3C73_794360 [compost metagenome]